jgi:hypothetical protein
MCNICSQTGTVHRICQSRAITLISLQEMVRTVPVCSFKSAANSECSGIGGIIALMLGIQRKDVKTYTDDYEHMGPQIFQSTNTFTSINNGAYFKSDFFKKAMRSVFVGDSLLETQ